MRNIMNKMLLTVALAFTTSHVFASGEIETTILTNMPSATPRSESQIAIADIDRLKEHFWGLNAEDPDGKNRQRAIEALIAASGNVWRAADVLATWQFTD
jgi:hypothetical protein